MTLIIETGAGVRTANAYANVSFVTNYLRDHGRETESDWNTRTTVQREAAIIASTAYIDTRWGRRFRGRRAVNFKGRNSRALVTVAGQPTDTETITVGSQTLTFVATANDFNVNAVLIGAGVENTIKNLIDAINLRQEVTAQLREDTTDQILLTALQPGVSGNDTALVSTATNVTVTNVFQNGEDSGSQPLSFPRSGLFDIAGFRVMGVPLRIKQAMAEYAVRAVTSSLYSDPKTDGTGRIVQEKFEKVGPLEERTVYAAGAILEHLIKPYPAADRMLMEFIAHPGVVR